MGKGRNSGKASESSAGGILTVDCGFSAKGSDKSIEYRWILHKKICKICSVKKEDAIISQGASYFYSRKGGKTSKGESVSSLWKEQLKFNFDIEN